MKQKHPFQNHTDPSGLTQFEIKSHHWTPWLEFMLQNRHFTPKWQFSPFLSYKMGMKTKMMRFDFVNYCSWWIHSFRAASLGLSPAGPMPRRLWKLSFIFKSIFLWASVFHFVALFGYIKPTWLLVVCFYPMCKINPKTRSADSLRSF